MIFFDYIPCCQPKASGFLVAFLMALVSIALMIVSALNLAKNSNSLFQTPFVIAALVFGIVGLLSCLDLVVGLMLEKRWLLVPFLVTFGILWMTTLGLAMKFLVQAGTTSSEEVSKSLRFYTPWSIIVTGASTLRLCLKWLSMQKLGKGRKDILIFGNSKTLWRIADFCFAFKQPQKVDFKALFPTFMCIKAYLKHSFTFNLDHIHTDLCIVSCIHGRLRSTIHTQIEIGQLKNVPNPLILEGFSKLQ